MTDSGSMPSPQATRWVQRNDTRVETVIDLLEAHQGIPEPPSYRDGLQVLVVTILSQNTTDPNALQAYLNLLEEFPPKDQFDRDPSKLPRDEDGNVDPVAIRMSQAADALPPAEWEDVRLASAETIEDCISVCGLQQSKTSTIQGALEWIQAETGTYDLSNIVDERKPAEAAKKLAEVKGVGVKTAAVTLMEAYQIDLCPVDTHVHRICQRLRLVEPSQSRDKTFRELQPIIPEGKGYSLHHNLLTFGRTVCTAQNPNCDECFLNKVCHYYRCEQGGEDLTVKFN